MRKIKMDKFYKAIVSCCFMMAVLAAGSVSYWGGYQPKEPEGINDILKMKKRQK